MGYIYKYNCTNCKEVKGEVAYGIGMLYPETNIDTRLFCCDDCGDVLSENINKAEIICTKCKQNAYELKLDEIHEKELGEIFYSKSKCPNCTEGRIQLVSVGLWD